MNNTEFWQQKWASNQIGFHLPDVNPLLTQYWSRLELKSTDSVFVPLCGKSEDLVWLAQHHTHVVGVELSNIALRAFFAEHFYTPTVTTINSQHELYQFDELHLYCGDYFTAPIEPVDAIYDRAALIAVAPALRQSYVDTLTSRLKTGGKILLVTLDYIQSEMTGPPYSVPARELQTLFGQDYQLTRIERDEANGSHPRRQKNQLTRFAEEVWLIEHQV